MLESLVSLNGVESAMPILKPFKLASSEGRPERSQLPMGEGVEIGGEQIIIIGGPCSVENREQIMESAEVVRAGGGHVLRGGAYKPRTSPYSFQGMAEDGLKLLAEAREKTGLPIQTEVMDSEDIDVCCEYADVLQIGARNVQNFSLLKKSARRTRPFS